MRASLHTLGCRLNQAETALLADGLKRRGYDVVPFGEPADLFVLNTCSVTEQAESDCRYAVRRALRASPEAFIAVTGCYAQTGVETLRRLPGVDLIVGTGQKMALPSLLPPPAALAKRPAPEVLHTRTIDRETFSIEGAGEYDCTRANLKIQDGCDFMCSFCLIPFARGRERSRAFADIMREAEILTARGHRELVLTGVNLGRYADGGRGLMALIQRLEAMPDVVRLRISSIEPTTIPDELIDHMAASMKLCRHLHVPIQSGDDGVLTAMNRRYTAADFARFVERAAARIPDVAIGTDVMVGFPGESADAFDRTVQLISTLPLAYLHVFSYSKRPGTAAARLLDGIPAGVIRERSRTLAELSRAKRLAFYRQHDGRTMRALFERGMADGYRTGLTDNFIRVGVRHTDDLAGRVLPVTIGGVMDGLAVGTLSAE